MTVKALSEYGRIAAKLAQLQRLLESLNSYAEQSRKSGGSFDNVESEIAAIKKEISELKPIIESEKTAVEDFISLLDDAEVKTYIRLHYVRGLTWTETAVITRAPFGEDSVKQRVYRYLRDSEV
ncbi:MAG: hypothetical protein LBN30_10970 [Oscillospiraceae bacterium]|jgi:hypothetical protein|nr:hypothetical protein [Oscillospiraceae bacterium]